MAAPIKDLSEINKHVNPVQAFLSSMDVVFKYNSKEVQSCLDQLDIETLRQLHIELCTKFITCFPVYAGRRPTHRQLKKTIVPDIYHLGYSIVCDISTKEADKIFGKELHLVSDDEDLITDKTIELEHLLNILTDLTKRVQGLEKEVKVIKQENSKLKELLQNDNHSVTSLSSQQTFISVPSNDPPSVDLPLTQPDPDTFDEPLSQTYPKMVLNTHPTLSDSTSSGGESCEESDSDAGSPFVPPNQYMKKIRKLENKVKKLSAIKSNKQHGIVKKTSETNKQKAQNHVKPLLASKSTGLKSALSDNHDREIYIGGVSGDNGGEDISGFLETKGINNVRQISRLSQNSFKFAVPTSDFQTVVKDIIWPKGIYVRAFRKKKWNSHQPQKRRQYRQPNNFNYRESDEFHRGYPYRTESREPEEFHYGFDRDTADY